MLTIIETNEQLTVKFNDATVLEAIWSGYIDQNYHHEVIQEAVVQIPSMGCTVTLADREAEFLIESIRQQRPLRADDLHSIVNLFPHVTLSLSYDSWECECCGAISDTFAYVKNNKSGKSLDLYDDGHFGSHRHVMPLELIQFCVYGWLDV